MADTKIPSPGDPSIMADPRKHYFHVADPWIRSLYGIQPAWGFQREDAAAVYYQNWMWAAQGKDPGFRDEFVKGPDRFDHDRFHAAFIDGLQFLPKLTQYGVLIIDFEAWPLTLFNPWPGDFEAERIEAAGGDIEAAEAEYTLAARACILGAYNIVRAHQGLQNARLGMYSGVYCGANQPPQAQPEVMAANDRQQWAHNAADVIAPRCYAPDPLTHEGGWWTNNVMAGHIEEAQRLKRAAGWGQVLAMVSIQYDGRWDTGGLFAEDYWPQYMANGAGADGLFHWATGPRDGFEALDTAGIGTSYQGFARPNLIGAADGNPGTE